MYQTIAKNRLIIIHLITNREFYLRVRSTDEKMWRIERGKAIPRWVAHPEDEVQHEDHILHAGADVREVVAPPAVIHHRVAAESRRISQTISVLERDPRRKIARSLRVFSQLTAMKHNLCRRNILWQHPLVPPLRRFPSRHSCVPAFRLSSRVFESAACPFRVPR